MRLHAACDTGAGYGLLLERCLPGTPLGQVLPEPDQDVVVAGLLRRLWDHPYQGYPFRPLAQMCQVWADEVEAGYATAPPSDRIDPGLAREGIALFRELPGTAPSQALLCTDLHGDNILAARRAPWLVIDPKPYAGDPAYDVLQHMLNCEGWTRAGCGCGCSPAPCRSPSARRSCTRWPGSSHRDNHPHAAEEPDPRS